MKARRLRFFWFFLPILRVEGAEHDAFAHSRALPATLPVAIAADNSGATLEAGEPIAAGGGASLWWSWTPASAGWVRITAKGAAGADTVLGLYTGAPLGALVTVFQNDIGLAGDTTADLVVPVAAGTTYRIQAGGAGGWSGPFQLTIDAVAPPPAVTSITHSPSTPDVTSGTVDVTGRIALSHPAGVGNSQFDLMWPDGETVHDRSLILDFTRITGTNNAGEWSLFHPLERYLPPGRYPFQLVARGIDSASVIYGRTTPFPPGVADSLTIANTGVIDSTPPEIVSLSIGSPSLDVTASGASVMVTLSARDMLSPIREDPTSFLRLRRPDGSIRETVPLDFRNRTAGNPAATPGAGTWSLTFSFPAGSPPGPYELGLSLTDQLLNNQSFGLEAPNSPPFPAGAAHTIMVANSGSVDTQPPVLTSISATPTTIDTAAGGFTDVTVQGADNLSGISSVRLAGGWMPVNGTTVVGAVGTFSLEGTAYRRRFSPPPNLPAGQYTLVGIEMTDALGNKVVYGPAALGYTPYPVGVTPPAITVLRPASAGPYRNWIDRYPSLQGLAADRLADPDADGFCNLVELALGLNPTLDSTANGTDPARGNAPVASRAGNSLRMEYKVASANLGTGSDAITITPRVSTDLRAWNGLSVSILGIDHFRASTNISVGQAGFLHLLISDPNP
jgi:hypothetical protein